MPDRTYRGPRRRRSGVRHRLTGALLAALCSPGLAADLTPADAGARFGQATSVARYCPGGHVTAAGTALGRGYEGEARAAFEAAAAKVVANWNDALGCREVDEETGRLVVSCRRIKLANCRQAWLEIGPQGSAVPGLVELSLDGYGEARRDDGPSGK